MKIDIVTDKNTEDAVVAESLEKGGHLIVVETETMEAQAMIPNAGDGKNFPQALIDYGCEAVVTGRIQQKAFDIIAEAQITRYNGYGLDIGTAAESAHFDILPLIVTFEGGKSCREMPHDHEHESCDCGHHHDEEEN